jgi:sugar phosphate isomerase/epimerase
MRIAFTTLGCPDWDIDTLCARGKAYGFDGVELRGLMDTLDVTMHPAFTTGLRDTQLKFADAGLDVCGIGSSIRICDPERRDENVQEAKRTIAVAKVLACRHVRVFGGGNPQELGRSTAAEVGRNCVQAILALDGARDLLWLVETHDHWVTASACAQLAEQVADPAFGVLWDVGNTLFVAGEEPAETFAVLGARIRYIHIKDALYAPEHELAMGSGWRYVAPGKGQLPIAEAVAVLKRNGYEDWVTFEHEKRWHPELPEPEEVFPEFVNWIKPLLV